ncbi:hypothetical protein C4K00_2989 [Pseudomonas synxantha]|nr:hypothetical protein C4K00_2989 [Pseudomonas synxantha]
MVLPVLDGIPLRFSLVEKGIPKCHFHWKKEPRYLRSKALALP